VTKTTLTKPTHIADADFYTHGLSDVAVIGNDATHSNRVSIYKSNGAGGFTVGNTFDVGSSGDVLSAIKAASLNPGSGAGHDNFQDLVILDQTQGAVFILLGDGAGNFAAPASEPAGGYLATSFTATAAHSNDLALADYNGDGTMDIAVANPNGGAGGTGEVAILSGAGDGTFTAATAASSFAAASPTKIISAAFDTGNNKTLPDIAILSGGGIGQVYINQVPASGFSFKTNQNGQNNSFPTAAQAGSLVAGDFDGDGKLDIATVSSSANIANSIAVAKGGGDGTFAAGGTYRPGTGTGPVDLARVAPTLAGDGFTVDINGGGMSDVAVADSTSNDVAILFGVNLPNQPVTTPFQISVDLAKDNTLMTDGSVVDFTVSIALYSQNLTSLDIQLVPPTGSGLSTIVLLRNHTNGDGTTNTNVGLSAGGSAMGLLDNGNPNNLVVHGLGDFQGDILSTTFWDDARRNIRDGEANIGGNTQPPYIGYFRPEGGVTLRGQVVGKSLATLFGKWTLQITDHVNHGTTPPPQFLEGWGLNFSSFVATGSGSTPGFGGVDNLAVPNVSTAGLTGEAGPLPGAISGTNDSLVPLPGASTVTATYGAPSTFGVAYDNTLGSFSPFQGRLYIAFAATHYNAGAVDDSASIFLVHSDNNGTSFSGAVQVNGDKITDNFSGGNRAQLVPSLAVDPVTGAVVVSYWDGRFDAAQARLSNTVEVSIDGGSTFSAPSFLNTPKTAIDAITGNQITIEPVPGNQALTTDPVGFGDRTGLVVYDGEIIPVYASNENRAFDKNTAGTGTAIFTATATFGGGPRVISGDMGPVTVQLGQTPGAQSSNNTYASDGTQQLSTFTITFDRPVDPSTFTHLTKNDQVIVHYEDVAGNITNIPVFAVTPLDLGTLFGPGLIGNLVGLATRFLITLGNATNTAPLSYSSVGTYSYTIGSLVSDRVRAPLGDVNGLQNSIFGTAATGPTKSGVQLGHFMDQNQDSIPGENGGNFDPQQGAITALLASIPNAATESGTTVTITTAKPHGFAVGALVTISGVGIGYDGTFTITATPTPTTFTYTAATTGLLDSTGGTASVSGQTAFDVFSVPAPATGETPFNLPYAKNTLPLILPGPHVISTAATGTGAVAGSSDSEVVNSSNSGLSVTFDRDIDTSTFGPAQVLQMVLPITNGGGTGQLYKGAAFTVAPAPGSATTFTPTLLITPTGASESGNTVTITTLGQHGFQVGNSVTISGVGVAGYNGTFTVASVTQDSFTYTDNNITNAGPSGGGTVTGPSKTVAKTFIIGFDPQSLSGTYTLQLASSIADAFGQKLDTNLNAGLDVLRGVNATNTVTTQTTFPSTGPTTLTSGQTVTSSISIAQAFTILQDNLTGDPTHHIQLQLDIDGVPDTSKLVANLIAPDGVTTVNLFTNVGGPSSDPHSFNNVTFDDFGSAHIEQSAPPFSNQSFTPQKPLSALIGLGTNGTWKLQISNTGPTATLKSWSLLFPHSAPDSNLGEPVADQADVHFRIFQTNPAPSNPLSSLTTEQWLPVGPASENSNGNSARIGALAVDPSDPSGNTVYVGGASGGVWKTTNFLTTDPIGPTYVPLTDLGPSTSLNIGGISLIPRNNDPNQTIVFVTTGEGDTGSPGVGLLRSLNGGKTWTVLDSTINGVAGPGPTLFTPYLESDKAHRDYKFVGNTSFKVQADPTPLENGEYAVYAAFSGPNGGVWRSTNTGMTWQLIRAGQATDLSLPPGAVVKQGSPNPGTLTVLYAGFAGEGVFAARGPALSASSMDLMVGGAGNQNRIIVSPADVPGDPTTAVPVNAPTGTPNGTSTRIVLAQPQLTNNPLQDLAYQGWVYAVVTNGTSIQGLYVTKDGTKGANNNWTQIQTPALQTKTGDFGSNDDTLPNFDVAKGQATYDISMAVDANNPNVVYIGGSRDKNVNGIIRVDITNLADADAMVPYDNSDSNEAAGAAQFATNGPADIGTNKGPGASFGVFDELLGGIRPGSSINIGGFYNLRRDPDHPFFDSTLHINNIADFANDGTGAMLEPYDSAAVVGVNPVEGSTDQHRVISYRDPLTGLTRLIFGDDQGVFTNVDNNGKVQGSIGTAQAITGSRNGNLQIIQHYDSAGQPSELAADIAGSLFFGEAQDDGFPVSDNNVLSPLSADSGVSGASVQSAGSGYAPGDTVTLTGGTFSAAAILLVTGVNGSGGITGVSVLDPGVYTVRPTNPVAQGSTSGFGANANFKLAFTTETGVATAAVNAGGSGYAVGDFINISGGIFHSVATLGVTSVGPGGAITGVSIFNPGNYIVPPTNPVAQASTTGTGSGANFNLTFGSLSAAGNLQWGGTEGDGSTVVTDPSGSGQLYQYRWPCCINTPPFVRTDFFLVTPPQQAMSSRTIDLPATDTVAFPETGPGNRRTFAVNPVVTYAAGGVTPANSAGLVLADLKGNIYISDQSTGGAGLHWKQIATTSNLNGDGSPAGALAFGAPDPTIFSNGAFQPVNIDNFIYAGTDSGKIFVTFNGGSTWKALSNGLNDGTGIQEIVTNPKRGSHEAYAVTSAGVYWMSDSSDNNPSPMWVKIDGIDANGIQTNFGAATAAVSAGGTGYKNGDYITLAAPALTFTNPTVLQVANADPVTGAVISVSIVTPGNYSVQPTSPVGQAGVVHQDGSLSTASGAKFTMTYTGQDGLFSQTRPIFNNPGDQFQSLKNLTTIAADWRMAISDTNAGGSGLGTKLTRFDATNAVIVNGGSGYKVGDLLTVSGGQLAGAGGVATVLLVTSVTTPGGAITGVSVAGPGVYINATSPTSPPTSPVSTTGGSGDQTAKFNVTYSPMLFPTLYVGGEGGVYRSLDRGQTWSVFPTIANDTAVQDGGYIPNAHVTHLQLMTGNINPADGLPSGAASTWDAGPTNPNASGDGHQLGGQAAGYNVLLATTYGRGDFAIRIDNIPGRTDSYKGTEKLPAGDKVLSIDFGGPQIGSFTPQTNATGTTLLGEKVAFLGPVDPQTFTKANITGLTDPSGATIQIASVTDVTPTPAPVNGLPQGSPHNVYLILFKSASSMTGTYHISINGITDFSGDPGGANNQPFTFTANTGPTISSVADQQQVENTPVGPIPFTVSSQNFPANQLVVTATSSNPVVVPNDNTHLTLVHSSGGNWTITITPQTNVQGQTTITLQVTDPNTLSNSTMFNVLFDTATTINTGGTDQSVVHTSAPTDDPITVNNPFNNPLTWSVSAVPAGTVVGQRYNLTAVNGNGMPGVGPVNLFQTLYGAGVDWLLGNGSPIAASPNGATESGNVVTITMAPVTTGVPPVFPVYQIGQTVKILGVGVAGYNGTFTITNVNNALHTFTYTDNAITNAGPSGSDPAGNSVATVNTAIDNPSGSWYHVFSDGTVTLWIGSTDPNVIATEKTTTAVATLDPSFYANPVIQFSLASFADATAKATATNVVNTFDLIYNGTSNQGHGLYYQTLFGVDWLLSANNSNPNHSNWFHLCPDGTIRMWNGGSDFTTEKVVGQVSPMVYQNPDALVTLPFASTAYNTQQMFALTGPISNFQNAYGQNEIWFKSANGSNPGAGQGYYQLLPDGTLHPWNGVVGVNISTEPTVAVLGNGGTVTPNSSYWFNPSLLVNAQPAVVPPPGVTATFKTPPGTSNTGATVRLDGYQNYTGQFGVALNINDGFITTTRDWLVTSNDQTLSLTLNMLNGNPVPPPALPVLPSLPPMSHTNVTGNAAFTATEPDSTPAPGLNTTAQVVSGAFAVDEALGLIFKGDYAPTLFGYNAKWLFSTKGYNGGAHLGWFNLFSDGTIRPWSGSSDPSTIASQPIVATLDASLWSNPDLLATGDAAQAAWNLENTFGGTGLDLTGTGTMQNLFGFNEKWFQSANGHNSANLGFYQITPDGVVHQWDGGRDIATETVVGRLNGSYWYNPSLITSLFGAPMPAQPPTGVIPGIGGTVANPTVTLSGATNFVGTFGVSTSFQDNLISGATATADFLVTTTDGPLVLTNPGTQTADHTLAGTQGVVMLTGPYHGGSGPMSTDPDNPPATPTFSAAVFNTMLDAQAFAVTSALGLSEFQGSFHQSTFGANVVWLKSTNGNNPNNLNWYNLFPDGTLRAWNGSTTPSGINSEGPVIATFSAAYYNNPNLLLHPVPVSGGSLTFGSGPNANVGTFQGFTSAGTFFGGVFVTDGIGTANAFTTFQINVS
jgi:subtilisin-like proprotein convertase family protein